MVDSAPQILHELRVHQIELQMQNEELRRIQESLEVSRARYFSLFDRAPVGYLVLMRRGVIQECNLAASRMLRAPKGEILERALSGFVLPADQDILYHCLNALRAGAESQSCELRLNGSKDDTTWLKLEIAVGFGQDAGEAQWLATLTDITTRKAAEAALEAHREQLESQVAARTSELAAARDAAEAADRAKSIFLATMSHEIRTPLNAIIGLGRVLQMETSSIRDLDQLGKLEEAARHLLQILDDTLDLSKIEAGQIELTEAPFSPGELVDETFGILGQSAQEKGLALVPELAPEVPSRLVGDSVRVRQILLNLVSNAIKFSERGDIRVCLSVLKDRPQDVELFVEVRDQGAGLSPDEQARLFQPFRQADDSIARRYGGTGLGLAIVKQLADRMGGRSGVISAPGAGSTFWVTLVLKKVSPGQSTESESTESESPGHSARDGLARLRADFAGARVLLAEDNIVNQELMLALLTDTGLLVDVVANGQEAVERVRQRDYALVLMDMQMPVLNGLDATRQIRRSIRAQDMPILGVTANAFDVHRHRCLESGMSDVIVKPIEAARLHSKLAHWLARSDARRTGPRA